MTTNSQPDLPFELYSKIFLLCLPLDGRVRPSSKSAPLLLAQICSRWRAIALATRELWSSVCLESPCFSDDPPPLIDSLPIVVPTTSLVDLWFTRSRDCHLSITLGYLDHEYRLPEGLVQVLKNCSTRWQRLELMLSPADLFQVSSITGPFPYLRTLAVDINHHLTVIPDGFTWNWEFYTHAPGLEAVRMGSLIRGISSFPKLVASLRMKSLEITIRRMPIAEIFNLFPYLHRLIIHSGFHSPRPSTLPSHVTAYLTCLIIDSPHILIDVTLPALKHLGVTMDQDQDLEDANIILSFVARSQCILTRFTLYGLSPSDVWSALLPVVNVVSTLELVDHLFDKIQYLPLHEISVLAFDFGDRYQRFLENRRRLQRVRIRIVWPRDCDGMSPNDDFVARLQALAAHDIHVVVETSTRRWPENAWLNIDEDYNVFNPKEPLPFYD
ncbi:hypothetical protein K438DRAFT_2028424 [Mycena galopus ATCC 62051]|nr:hypothetical protein K438DRAFT_2028424 [Mycena galopus ATCC 62051]